MKVLYTTLFLLLINFLEVNAQDKVSVSKKEAFNSLSQTEAVSKIILTDFKDGLPSSALEFLNDNSAFLSYTISSNILVLNVKLEKNEKVVYLKLFSQLGIHEVEIQKGKEKGRYSIEDFLNMYNL